MRALVALVLALLASTADARNVTYAVVIGNNAPPADASGTGLATLRYADDDAVRYYKMLSQFSRTTLLSTLDDQTQKRHAKVAAVARVPSLDELRQVFATLGNDMRLDREAGNEPVLYFVFSGHGAISEAGDSYLSLTDGRLTQRVLFDELLGSLPTPRVHVIIDACHAAGVVGARGGTFFDKEATGETAPVTEAEQIAITKGTVLQKYPNVGVIVATPRGNETHEWSAIEAGVFSYEVLSGLAGPADVNGDRTVEYSELHAFVANANRSINNPRAVPVVVSEPPRSDRRSPIIKLKELRNSYLLHGNVGNWGRFSIETEGGERLLDANMTKERPVTVALPIGSTVFVRTAKGEAKVASRGKAVATNDLEMTAPTVAARSGVDADYRQNLFATPYGPTYYSGFVDSTGAVAVDFDINLRVQGELYPEPPPRVEPDLDPGRWSRRGGYFIAGLAIIPAVAMLASAYWSYDSYQEYRDARTQEEARWANHDYSDATTTFWVSAAITGALVYSSYRLIKRGRRLNAELTPPRDAAGPPGLSLGGRF